MEEIIIERYESPKVNMHKLTGELVGVINNEHEFNKVRIQMLRKNVTDKYYFMWNDIRIDVSKEGDMSKFPAGLYDQVNRDLAEIFKITRKIARKRVKKI